jgi:hypothetical protein
MAQPSSALPTPVTTETAPGPMPVSLNVPPADEINEPAPLLERTRSGARDAYEAAREAVSAALVRARRTFHHIANNKPVQMVCGIAVVGLLVGAGLRLWRGHYE